MSETNKRILGIDPGIARTGWGIVKCHGTDCEAIASGCIETTTAEKPQSRLLFLYQTLVKIEREFRPSEAAIEKIFFNTNAKTALSVGEARGVTILSLAQAEIPIFQYTPLEVKLATTSFGRADKKQVQQMVKILLNLKTVPSPDDVADALAVALTHAVIRISK